MEKKKMTVSPWRVKSQHFPERGNLERKIKFLLNYAILAPSGHNSQPWKFSVYNHTAEIKPDYDRVREIVDPENRELFISLGAAAKNFEIAAHYFGMIFHKRIDADKIVFEFKEGKTNCSQIEKFKAMLKRRTNRGEYFSKPIEREKVEKLSGIEGKNSRVEIFDQKSQKQQLAELVHDAALIWYKSKGLMDELEGWLRDDVEMYKDGIPMGVLNLYKVATEIKYMFASDGETAIKKATHDRNMVMESPLLAAVTTNNDSVEEWIEAGEKYEELALEATCLGLSNAFFNIVVELKGQREKLAQNLGIKGKVQMLLRLGYAKTSARTTPRRPIREIIG